MKKSFWLLVLATIVSTATTAFGELTGPEVLARTVAYHDPTGTWMQQRMKLKLQTGYADGPTRIRTSRVDFATGEYADWLDVEGVRVEQSLRDGECEFRVNGQLATDAQIAEHEFSCERAHTTRDYVSYLWGLPMKLNDPGTVVDPVVRRVEFEGREALDLKVTYDPKVGTDIWHFYLDPATYALFAYAFYKDEAETKGEIILLTDEIRIGQARVPRARAWYEMPGREYLGTDTLLEARLIPR